jgi:hypothetical protein
LVLREKKKGRRLEYGNTAAYRGGISGEDDVDEEEGDDDSNEDDENDDNGPDPHSCTNVLPGQQSSSSGSKTNNSNSNSNSKSTTTKVSSPLRIRPIGQTALMYAAIENISVALLN